MDKITGPLEERLTRMDLMVLLINKFITNFSEGLLACSFVQTFIK